MISVERFVNSRFNSNTYILSFDANDDIWVIDPGDTDSVFHWMVIHKKNVVTGILLTHSHFDHIYGINEIVSRFPGCVVYIANDYGLKALRNPKENGSKYTVEGPVIISDNATVGVNDSTIQLWEDVIVESFCTPGHSDDSQCFLVDGLLFTGDTLIKDVKTVTKLKGGSVDKLEGSMRIIASLKGNNLRVMPGHGDAFGLDEYNLNKMIINHYNQF